MWGNDCHLCIAKSTFQFVSLVPLAQRVCSCGNSSSYLSFYLYTCISLFFLSFFLCLFLSSFSFIYLFLFYFFCLFISFYLFLTFFLSTFFVLAFFLSAFLILFFVFFLSHFTLSTTLVPLIIFIQIEISLMKKLTHVNITAVIFPSCPDIKKWPVFVFGIEQRFLTFHLWFPVACCKHPKIKLFIFIPGSFVIIRFS